MKLDSVSLLLGLGLALTLVFSFSSTLNLGASSRQKLVKRNLRRNEEIVSQEVVYVTCDDGEVTNAILDDNYCDCKDGSDEPSTSACSFSFPAQKLFNCLDPASTKIYLSRVNDNVCDCPNGMDENDSMVLCAR